MIDPGINNWKRAKEVMKEKPFIVLESRMDAVIGLIN